MTNPTATHVTAALSFLVALISLISLGFREIGIVTRRRAWIEPFYDEILIAAASLCAVSLLVGMVQRRIGGRSRSSEVLHENAWAKNAGGLPLTAEEQLRLDIMAIDGYIVADGIDGGIGNWGPDRARAALPALDAIGLTRARRILEEAIGYFERANSRQMTEQETATYFDRCEDYQRRLREAGLTDLPDRLEASLAPGPN